MEDLWPDAFWRIEELPGFTILYAIGEQYVRLDLFELTREVMG